MKQIITAAKKDPLGAMLLDYLAGDKGAYVTVTSTTLEMWKMTGEVMFRTFSRMNRLEKKALTISCGSILDVGAGSGCHSLCLQKRGLRVDSLDISPGCVRVMEERGVRTPVHGNLFTLSNVTYDTVLMLMNGMGLCGSIDGIILFFQFIPGILSPGGQVIVDSTDLASLYDLEKIAPPADRYYGETRFRMSYQSVTGDPFDWLYIDFDTLRQCAAFHGFKCEKIMSDASHRYLARLSVKKH